MKSMFLLLGSTLAITSTVVLPVNALNIDTPTSVRCERVSTTIDTLSTRYADSYTRHSERYQQVHDNISGKLSDLAAAGLDVSQLSEDLRTLKAYILSFDQAHTSFQKELRESKQLICADNEVDYRTKVEAARGQLQSLRETARDALTLIRSEIRADLQALRTEGSAQ